jgi:hypothetical protein
MTSATTAQRPFQLGSVSTGTLLTQELLNAFEETLTDLGSTIFQTEPVWEYEEGDLLQLYYDTLDSLCPPFVYFGLHPGDGADFGFWVDGEAINYYAPSSLFGEETFVEDFNVYIRIDEDDSITVCDADHQEIWSV